MDVALAGCDGPHRADDLRVGRLLEHVAARPGLERLAHVAGVVLHRQHEHLRLGTACSSAGMPSIPLLPGMTTSMRTTSGLCLDRLEDAPAPRSRASPTISMSASASSTRRRPLRTTAWSSTTSTRMVIGSGTSATIVVPRRTRDSIRDRPPTSATARACRRGRARPLRAARVEAPPVVLDHGHDGDVLARDEDADTAGVRVLHDVRQRLLDDAVERVSTSLGQALLAELRLEVDPELRLLAARARRAARAPATSPKSSSAAGRSSTASRRTSCSVETTSSPHAPRPPPAPRPSPTALERLQAEQDRGQRLAGLVVQLAREPLAARAPAPRPRGGRRRGSRARRGRPRSPRAPPATPRGARPRP